MSLNVIQGEIVNPGRRVGVVTSRFNSEITERLEKGALDTLSRAGLADTQIVRVRVPGAVEIPLAVRELLQQGCAAVVALGAVVRGDTAHFDYVCRAVERGCSNLQLQYGRPVAFGVLTTDNEEQALSRAGGAMGNKGAEAAEVALEMIDLLTKLNPLKTHKE